MRSFIDIVTQTKPSKRLDEVFDATSKFAFISQFSRFIIEGEVEEATWHQDRRPIDPRDKNGKWNVHDNPPGGHASIMQFGSEQEANDYVERRKRLGSGQHCHVVPPRDMRESSLQAIGMDESFDKVAKKIEREEGVSKDAAGAILANSTRHASKKAKAKNPKLKKVK